MTAVAGKKAVNWMIDWKVCETELEESIKKVLAWSHLIDLPTGVRGGGGCRSQVVKMRRTERKTKRKKKKRGGETRHPETKAGQKPPSRLRSIVSFRDGFFRVTCS